MHLLAILFLMLQADPERSTNWDKVGSKLADEDHVARAGKMVIREHFDAGRRVGWSAESDTLTPEELLRELSEARVEPGPARTSAPLRRASGNTPEQAPAAGVLATVTDFEAERLGDHTGVALSVPAGGSGAVVGDLEVIGLGPEGPPNFDSQAVVLYDTARIILVAGSDGITGMGWSMTDLAPTDVRGYLKCQLPDGAFISLLLDPGVQPQQSSFAVLIDLRYVDGGCTSWVGSCTLGAYPFEETEGDVSDLGFDNVIVAAE